MGWEERITLDGRAFYFDPATSRTVWEKPPGFESPLNLEQRQPEGAGHAASTWEEHPDETSGHSYWFDRATGATSWNPPAAARRPTATETAQQQRQDVAAVHGKAAAAAAAARADRVRSAQDAVDADAAVEAAEAAQAEAEAAEAEAEAAEAEAEAAQAEADLAATSASESEAHAGAADGWYEAVDPESGCAYYSNAATHESSWERPAALGGSLAQEWREEWAEGGCDTGHGDGTQQQQEQ